MKRRNLFSLLLAGLYAGVMLLTPLWAQAGGHDTDDDWHLTGELYLWGASIGGTTRPGGDVNVGLDDLLDNLDVAFMGGLEARKSRWLLIGDLTYLDVSAGQSGSLTDLALVTFTADVDVEGWVVNLLAGYSMVNTDTGSADIVFGARYLEVDVKLNVSANVILPPPGLDFSRDKKVWDGVVGLQGDIRLSENFFIPYYVDIGTGQSDFTWQAILGVGYKPRWGEITLGYRHIYWEFESGSALSDLNFSGPGLLVRYNFF